MKLKDRQLLHQQNLKELNLDLVKQTSTLKKLKLDLATNKLKDTSQLKKVKRQIAIIKTIIHSRSKADQPQVEELTK